MLHTTKLLACFLLCFSCFSCDSEKRTSSKNAPNEQIEEQRKSALQKQILLMLRGEVHDENLLRKEIELLGWEKSKETYHTCIDSYVAEYGKRPKKIIMGRTLMRLSRINGDIGLSRTEKELREAQQADKEALKRLERSIQEAIEKEKSKHR